MAISDQTVITLINSFLAAIPPTIVALAGLIATLRNGQKTDKLQGKAETIERKADTLSTSVNGRMDQLLQTTKESAHKDGKEAGIREIVEKGQVGVVVGVVPTAQGQENQQNNTVIF